MMGTIIEIWDIQLMKRVVYVVEESVIQNCLLIYYFDQRHHIQHHIQDSRLHLIGEGEVEIRKIIVMDFRRVELVIL